MSVTIDKDAYSHNLEVVIDRLKEKTDAIKTITDCENELIYGGDEDGSFSESHYNAVMRQQYKAEDKLDSLELWFKQISLNLMGEAEQQIESRRIAREKNWRLLHSQPPISRDLFAEIGEQEDMRGFCGSSRDSDPYWEWEKRVAIPKIKALGYANVYCYDGERDSFGPLIRIVYGEKNCRRYEFWYG